MFNPHNSSYTDVSMSLSYTSGLDENEKAVSNNYIVSSASWQLYKPWRPKVKGFKRGNFTLATRLKTSAIVEPLGALIELQGPPRIVVPAM